ncbi:MAG: fructose-bisphosphatase class III, partial [Bacilli bacterium]|nr:fructose-bisphosphatase class III [Bacilli bacterium]
MRDLDYLRLLSKTFPNKEVTLSEIINLSAIMELPKGTEYFLSDIHGEYESFSYLIRSSSGVILNKIHTLFGDELSLEEEKALANLVCYPRDVLHENKLYSDPSIQKQTLNRLIRLASMVSSKYTRSKVRKKMPASFGYALDELMHTNEDDLNKATYHEAILDSIIENHGSKSYIIALCELIQNLAIDHLHIVGDIFDRGPRPDKIMDDLIHFHDIDIEWGNHDVSWMGASIGNLACICNVLHIAINYNSFDVLEDGYGINLRPLSMYAKEVYKDDPCERFKPHLLDDNVSDYVEPELAAKMCKAVSILLF